MSEVAQLPPHVAAYCRNITRQRARNFFYGLKLLPEPQRSALYVVYTWMRKADDLVDNEQYSPEQKNQQLAAFRTATECALAGSLPDDDPVWLGIAFVANRFGVSAAHLHAMLDGQLEDVRDRRFESFDALYAYCYKVASTVGLICIEIWGYRDPAAPQLAIKRGIAFQLTNILRDLREDIDNNRVYLPLQDFADHDLTPELLRRWAAPERCRAFLMQQIERAETYYQQSASLDAMITPACRATLWAMTSIYRNLLDKIRQDPSQVVAANRVRLSTFQKAAIAMRARWALPAAAPLESSTV